MANWAYVCQDQVQELHDALPRNWRNISGLYLVADDLPVLAQLGWLPVVRPPQSFDSTQYQVREYSYRVESTQVLEIPVLVPNDDPAPTVQQPQQAPLTLGVLLRSWMAHAGLDQEQTVTIPVDRYPELEHCAVIDIDRVRTLRDQLLAHSDHTQLADTQHRMSESSRLAWSEYRQFLRDLPNIIQDNRLHTLIDPSFLQQHPCC